MTERDLLERIATLEHQLDRAMQIAQTAVDALARAERERDEAIALARKVNDAARGDLAALSYAIRVLPPLIGTVRSAEQGVPIGAKSLEKITKALQRKGAA